MSANFLIFGVTRSSILTLVNLTNVRLELQSQKLHWCKLRKNFCSWSLASKSTLEEQYFIDSEPKGEGISSKIDQLVAIYTSKFKWQWWAQFLSQTFQILEINLSFEAGKMTQLYLIKISLSFWYTINGNEFPLQLKRPPRLSLLYQNQL